VVIGGNENILATSITHHDHTGLARLHKQKGELRVSVYIVLAFCITDFTRSIVLIMRHFLKLQSMLLKNLLYKQISIWTLVTAGTNTSEALRDFAC
jgi:hypothetical protein